MLEEVKKQIADGKRVLIAVPNTGEVERLADIFTEYSRLVSPGQPDARRRKLRRRDFLLQRRSADRPRSSRPMSPTASCCPRREPGDFGARDLFDESEAVVVAVRSGTNRRPPHFFLTSVICTWATTLSTLSTASGSIRD